MKPKLEEPFSLFQSKLSESRSIVSSLEVTISELRGESQALQQRVEKLSNENMRVSCEMSEVSGSAASNMQALTKRNEALQKMVRGVLFVFFSENIYF